MTLEGVQADESVVVNRSRAERYNTFNEGVDRFLGSRLLMRCGVTENRMTINLIIGSLKLFPA